MIEINSLLKIRLPNPSYKKSSNRYLNQSDLENNINRMNSNKRTYLKLILDNQSTKSKKLAKILISKQKD